MLLKAPRKNPRERETTCVLSTERGPMQWVSLPYSWLSSLPTHCVQGCKRVSGSQGAKGTRRERWCKGTQAASSRECLCINLPFWHILLVTHGGRPEGLPISHFYLILSTCLYSLRGGTKGESGRQEKVEGVRWKSKRSQTTNNI